LKNSIDLLAIVRTHERLDRDVSIEPTLLPLAS
jgi:hypothetical protein